MPENITRTVTYIVGIVVFGAGILGFDLAFLADALPSFLDNVWVTVAAIIAGARGLWDLIDDAIKNRGNSFVPLRVEDGEK